MSLLDAGTVPCQPPEPLLRQAGQEPLAGYRLLEPLGRGGFGEVWKCSVSGGLVKAIKFVEGAEGGEPTAKADPTGADGPLGSVLSPGALELAALEQVKSIRHPFLLSIERIEILAGTLLIVMELADRNLQAVLLEYQVKGQPGIPRAQLLSFLCEAAEALDVLNFRHGLQHLDIKPHNLFVIGNHVKVGDFGLVRSLRSDHRAGGLTPIYAAPELYQRTFSRHSDQYSLAIVYQQMLTSSVPFASPDPVQLRLQHLTGTPDLSALPEADRAVVLRGLAKDPEKRYPSCQEFVQALQRTGGLRPSNSLAGSVRLQQVLQTLHKREPAHPTTATPREGRRPQGGGGGDNPPPHAPPCQAGDPQGKDADPPGSKTTPLSPLPLGPRSPQKRPRPCKRPACSWPAIASWSVWVRIPWAKCGRWKTARAGTGWAIA